jgi:hypothetical protein
MAGMRTFSPDGMQGGRCFKLYHTLPREHGNMHQLPFTGHISRGDHKQKMVTAQLINNRFFDIRIYYSFNLFCDQITIMELMK